MQIRFSEPARAVPPGHFVPAEHYYPRALNAQIHSAVSFFLGLSPERVLARFCHLNPAVDPVLLGELLRYRPRYLAWGGADLLHVTTAEGVRRMVVLETNSCPSGQKSMPLYFEADELGGYRRLLERTFLPLVGGRRLPAGDLAVLYDKNEMEASGYAAALADLVAEPVHLVSWFDGDPDPAARFGDDGLLQVRDGDGRWRPIRAALRYVTQRPWNRIPVATRTLVVNPIIACLAGGRNKALAARAYEMLNGELEGSGLALRTPQTTWDVSKEEIPRLVAQLGGLAVVKVPYSNCGQGVFTLTSPRELERFMMRGYDYDRFIVQSLVGSYHWQVDGDPRTRLFHVGTVPDRRRQIFAADLRMMLGAGQGGFRPLAVYARRARAPLCDRLGDQPSWEMLGTNLSVREEDRWETRVQRLLLVDRRDFNALGLGIDDLVDGLIQTVLAMVAIDKLAGRLLTQKGRLRMRLFGDLNRDPALIEELVRR